MSRKPRDTLIPLALSVAMTLGVASCTSTGEIDKTKMGVALGAVAGAAIGAKASGHNKTAGILLGGLVGGLVGGKIGAMLDERDRARLAQSTEQTFRTGASQNWTNPDTGVTATTVVKEETVTPQQQVQIPVLKGKVQQLPPLELIGEDYTATTTANVRGGPGTDYVVVDSLPKGSVTRVVGKVDGADWYLVSKNNAGSGFVAGSLLKPAPASAVAAAPAATIASSAEVTHANVAATATCRVVTQEVSKGGEKTTQDVKACRGPNGWEIVMA